MDIYNNLCRSCNIEKQKMVNIHNTKNHIATTSIKEMLEYCLQTTIAKENKYPQHICYDCIKQLEISFRFLKRFHLAQREFEEVFTKLEKSNDVHCCLIKDDNVDETISEAFDENLMHIYEGSNNNDAEHLPFTDVEDKPCKNLPTNVVLIKPATNTLENPTIISITPSPENVPAIICSLCNKSFYTTKALNLHQKLSHKRKI